MERTRSHALNPACSMGTIPSMTERIRLNMSFSKTFMLTERREMGRELSGSSVGLQ